ncbi:MAG: hypothetical protein HOF53_14025 [Gammaproteobacteria bacterium]|nr:hypothetical protein [Gammaproteobacteria bacterium]
MTPEIFRYRSVWLVESDRSHDNQKKNGDGDGTADFVPRLVGADECSAVLGAIYHKTIGPGSVCPGFRLGYNGQVQLLAYFTFLVLHIA